jgi:very-short-patch-repair endonuclease
MRRPPGREMLERARGLRRNMTAAERLVWSRLKSRQLGVKFRRQMWLRGFIADFASVEAMLVIELDGGQHDRDRQRDQRRTAAITEEGYSVLRFWNNEVFENLDGVLEIIAMHLPSPSRAASPCGPLPLPEGERAR